jgi:hypothetical protein
MTPGRCRDARGRDLCQVASGLYVSQVFPGQRGQPHIHSPSLDRAVRPFHGSQHLASAKVPVRLRPIIGSPAVAAWPRVPPRFLGLSSSRRVKKGPGRRPRSAKRQRFMKLRERGWSILAAAREVSVFRTTGNNWSRSYKTSSIFVLLGELGWRSATSRLRPEPQWCWPGAPQCGQRRKHQPPRDCQTVIATFPRTSPAARWRMACGTWASG